MGMLLLTRKIGEKITLGDDIEITVVGVQGNQVKLGIDAPREIPVVRNELLKNKKGECECTQ